MTATRLAGISRGKPFEIEVDGQIIPAFKGETLATVLSAAGIRSYTANGAHHPPGRLYCGMGTCHQCLVTVNGHPNYQACRTLAVPGMKVELHHE
jgi:predicted molibdopterin-dependent oxidoreductase YjgC